MSEGHTERLEAALDGKYRIERKLGEGGMATVYLAEDIKHERKVALKILRPELAAVIGAERFLSEIKTTANLQHPHILPLFDSGEAGGYLYYVMPYIDGETLREKLDREKQLGVEEAVRIARDVADALDYAHRAGVIHRDIKPGNILLHDGRPVVADFGIALAVSAAGGGRMTETGLSLGTPHYMSPEQASADRDLSARSDVYSLGCVLYEMLTGQPPHTGPSAQSILVHILTKDVTPLTELRHTVPANVAAAVARSIEKLPADRFETAKEFMAALGDDGFRYDAGPRASGVSLEKGSSSAAAFRSGGRNPLAIGASTVAAILGAIALWGLLRVGSAVPTARFEITLPAEMELAANPAAISPDGSRIVFAARTYTGEAGLWLRPLDQLAAVQISGTEGARHPAFSPDGESIAFFGGGALKTVSLSGGPPNTVVAQGVMNSGVSWGPDGFLYFSLTETRGLARVSENGGDPEHLTFPDPGDHAFPAVLPNGRGVLLTRRFTGGPSVDSIAVLSLETGSVTNLFQGTMARYSRTGHIANTSADGVLLGRSFDQGAMEVTGPARSLEEGVAVAGSSAGLFSMSDNGVLVYRPGRAVGVFGREVVPTWVDRGGSDSPVDPANFAGTIEIPRISPDGRKVAVQRNGQDGPQIWIYDLEQQTFSPLTFEGGARPFWHPNGIDVGFLLERDGEQAVYAQPWDRSAEARLVRLETGNPIFEASWTADGEWLVFEAGTGSMGGGGNGGDLFYAAAEPDSASIRILDTPFEESVPDVSPDGRWLAYQSLESGEMEVYVRPFRGPGGRSPVSVSGGFNPLWLSETELMYHRADGEWVVATIEGEGSFSVRGRNMFARSEGYFVSDNTREWDVSPDGERILALRNSGLAESAQARDVVVQGFLDVIRERLDAN